MNTNKVKKTTTEHLPHFPVLKNGRNGRQVTKHFVNCSLYMDHEHFCFLTWLIYQCNSDNTFYYNTSLYRRYIKSVIMARQEYGTKNKTRIDMFTLRKIVVYLLNNGYIIWFNHEKMVINPMLMYNEKISKKAYLEICREYNQSSAADIKNLIVKYVSLIREPNEENNIQE